VTEQPTPSPLPAGSSQVAQWAAGRRIHYDPRPQQEWFLRWEPFDTITSPARYYNACSWPAPPGSVTIAEPWTEEGIIEPMDRTIFAFASHPGLRFKASMRSGEDFITRVSFITQPPPAKVELGDAAWDQHVVTHAASVQDARGAFTTRLRALVQQWGFRGHIEVRPGCVVIHCTGIQPTPAGYEHMVGAAAQIVTAALTPG